MSDEINDPIAVLRHELSSVAPSSDFATRVRGRLSDELDPLRAELADLTASPEFAVRVRQQIEGQRRPGLWSTWTWRWILPASGLAAATIVAMMLLRPAGAPAPEAGGPHFSAGGQVFGVGGRVFRPGLANATPTVPSQAAPATEPARAVRALARAETPAVAPAPAQPRDPMLEVITDQPELLRTLWVRVESGVAVDSTEPAGIYQAPKIEVAPIEVSPIAVFVVPDPRGSIGVLPFILRIAADSAGRSSR